MGIITKFAEFVDNSSYRELVPSKVLNECNKKQAKDKFNLRDAIFEFASENYENFKMKKSMKLSKNQFSVICFFMRKRIQIRVNIER